MRGTSPYGKSLNHLGNKFHFEIFYVPVKQSGAEQCQAQTKLSYPASSLKLFLQVEMNKVQ
jgi:hypothetical protein